MWDFFEALARHSFLQNAVAAGILASLGCGIVGTYVVVKRIGFMAGGIAHAVLGGMGAAIFFGLNPVGGALAAAILAASRCPREPGGTGNILQRRLLHFPEVGKTTGSKGWNEYF